MRCRVHGDLTFLTHFGTGSRSSAAGGGVLAEPDVIIYSALIKPVLRVLLLVLTTKEVLLSRPWLDKRAPFVLVQPPPSPLNSQDSISPHGLRRVV
jgi:hypothetical protein